MTTPTRLALVLAALAAAVLPLPDGVIERWYSEGAYPRLQRILTGASNLIPIPLFDVLCIAALAGAVLTIIRCLRAAGWRRGALAAGARLLAAAAVTYLIFLAAWGLNYRRIPLEEKLRFDRARVSAAGANQLLERTVADLNHFYMSGHGAATSTERLASGFHDALRTLRAPPAIVPGRPKWTLLGGYFHNAAIAGMTDPFFLETLIAPDLLDVERPFVIAHEWAHLAGYADESEANFVAWLACLRAGPQARYSAALTLIGHAYAAASNAREAMKALQTGPSIDLRIISDRYATTPRLVRFAARETYDRYLKANRVERGVESYDAVVELILGTAFDQNGNPQLR